MRVPTNLTMPLTAVVLALSACSASNGSSSHSGPNHYVSGGTFTMAVSVDPGAFDPYKNRLTLGASVLAYDSLVNLRQDGTFVSGLAQKWSADANSATFVLRPGVTCSDGTPLTAGQIADDLKYVGDAKNSPAQYGVNVPTVPYRVVSNDSTRTVKVTIKRPYGFLLNTLGQVPIVCASGMKDRKALTSASTGTGPFVLTSVVPGQSYTFTVRKGYTWGPGGASTAAPGTPAKVVLKVVTNETTAANLLLSGEVNFAKITSPDQQRLTANGLKKSDWKLAGAWLTFNQGQGHPTADLGVRRALTAALDPGQVIQVSTGGSGGAATGLVSMEPRPCTDNTAAGQLPKHDMAAAGALLDQAGWVKGTDGTRRRGGKPLTIGLHYYPGASSYERPTAELMVQQWKALGLDVKTSADTGAATEQALYQTYNWDVYLIGYNFTTPGQMVPYLSGATPPNGNNTSFIHNPQYDKLAAKAVSMTAPAACPYWSQAERAIVSDVDVAPISNRVNHWFLRNAQAQIQRYDAPVPMSIRVIK